MIRTEILREISIRMNLKDVKEDEAAAKDGNRRRGQVHRGVFARFRVVFHPRFHNDNGRNELHGVGDVNSPRQDQAMHKTANHGPKGRAKAHDGCAHQQKAPGVGFDAPLPELPEQKAHDRVDRHEQH